MSKSGRISVSKKAWVFRVTVVSVLILLMIFNLSLSLAIGDPLIVYSTLMPTHALVIFIVGWFFFKKKPQCKTNGDLVSVIIPVYNQESLIEKVIDAVLRSTYSNLEVVAVNDGSKDNSGEILDSLCKKYPRLRVIHKPNGGKRTAVATGFYASTGKFIILIDSDSIVDENAIEEFMRTFSANPKVGGMAGNGRVLNADKNLLTRCQDVWYDSAFNIHKTTESTFGNVLCCSGCLAAYRREAIARFIPFWAEVDVQMSDDRDLTTYVAASSWAKKEMAPLSQRLMESMAKYDDSEDRGLTAQTLTTWETVYVPTAVVYTEVPEKMRSWIRQQTRWRKGYLRSSTFVSAFFWKKHPLMALVFYTEFMQSFLSPVILVLVYIYTPLFLHNYLLPITHLFGQLLLGFASGLDYRLRDPMAKNWVYKPLISLLTLVVIPCLLFPAIWTYKKNRWLTR
jgi:hyaluronan synthase